MVFHIRHVSKCNEGNPDLSGGSVELCSRGGLLGVFTQKPHNVPHKLEMGRLMSI